MKFEEIEQLYNYGFSIIPIIPTGSDKKKPYIKWYKYQFKKASLEQLRKWHAEFPDMNAGIIMKSSNLIVLDLESEEALQEIEKHGTLPKTVTVESGRFRHYYFKRGSLPPHLLKFITDADMIVNTYVIGVGSKHISGKEYKWLISPDQCEAAECPKWLIDLVKEKRLQRQEERKARKRKRKHNNSEHANTQVKEHIPASLDNLTLEQRFKRSLKQVVKKKPEIRIHKALDTSISKGSDINVNFFNRHFKKRDQAVPYILWDKKNEWAKKNGKDFYVTYGIILEESKNKLRQLGEYIVNTLKKNGLTVQCNDFLSGRIRISNS